MYLNWICVFLCLVVPPFHHAITAHRCTTTDNKEQFGSEASNTQKGKFLWEWSPGFSEHYWRGCISHCQRHKNVHYWQLYFTSIWRNYWWSYLRKIFQRGKESSKNATEASGKTCFIVNDKFNTWTRTLTTSRNNLKELMNVE